MSENNIERSEGETEGEKAVDWKNLEERGRERVIMRGVKVRGEKGMK